MTANLHAIAGGNDDSEETTEAVPPGSRCPTCGLKKPKKRRPRKLSDDSLKKREKELKMLRERQERDAQRLAELQRSVAANKAYRTSEG